jgi:DNA-binding NtrC family response regulator
MLPACILIVDDKPDVRLSLKVLLNREFSKVLFADNPETLENLLKSTMVDVVLLDMNYTPGQTTGEEGLKSLRQIKRLSPLSQVVLMTAYAGIELAVNGLKAGATDFVVKPWDNDKLLATLTTAYRISHTEQKFEDLKSHESAFLEDSKKMEFPLLGQSVAMRNLFATIKKVAPTDASVLILGENGTGKELVAKLLHQTSLRASEPFIRVDLGSIQASLFEDEMFGHAKGAFTDAREARAGRFELAHKGSIFLDEIGNLAPALQPKLLSVLENRTVNRLGSNASLAIDVRLISATNLTRHQLLQTHCFREDLYFRINTVELLVPPLREREDDVELLALHYLNTFKLKYRKPDLKLKPESMDILRNYNWPGNVRELMHTLERAVIMADTQWVKFNHSFIPDNISGSSECCNLEQIERKAIIEAMRRNKGNMRLVAKELGLGRSTIYRKIQKYGI